MEMTVKPVVAEPASPNNRSNPTGISSPALKASDPAMAPTSWFGSALSAFIDMMEPAVTRLSAGKRLVAVESSDGRDLSFYLVSRRRSTAIGKGAEDREALIKAIRRTRVKSAELRIDPGRLSAKRFKIPAAGAQFALQIVESRLDRLTPWRPEAVVHGFALSNKPGPDGQLDVDFLATSQEIAGASIDHLAQFGLAASALGSAQQESSERLRVDLFAGGKDNLRKSRRRRIGIASVAVVAVCLFACCATFFTLMQTTQRIAELDALLAKARNRMVNATGSTAERDQDFAYIATKQLTEARFHLIDRLAAILPDNTYLDELNIEPTSVRIAGSSTDASSLIKLLEADAAFRDVRFSAPVTRQEDGRDRFEITAVQGTPSSEATQ